MDPEFRQMFEMVKENNKMLHKLLRDLHWRRFWGIVRWSIIIGSAVGLYVWLQPFIDQLIAAYQSLPNLFAR